MEERVGRGAIVLIVSGLLSKIFGALFRLPLTNIIGIKGIGIFQMAMAIYSLMLVFVSGGVTNSLAKLVASARAVGNSEKIYSLKKVALIFSVTAGLLIGLIFAVFFKGISSLQGIENGGEVYLFFLLLLPLGGAIGVFRGIVQGHENMTPTAISQIIEQSIKFLAGLLFAYLFGKQNSGSGVFGAFLGITISEFVAFIYLLLTTRKKYKFKKGNLQVGREFFSAALPLTFSAAVNPLTNAIESLFIVALLAKAGIASEKATALYGLQTGVVGALMHFPLIISLSVAMALLPKLSYLFQTNDVEGQKNILSQSFKYMWFFLVPLTIGIISISGVLYPIIYPNIIGGYLNIVNNLTIISGFSIILSALMQFLLSIVEAKGKFKEAMAFSVVGGIFKIATLVIFAQSQYINIFAISISNIVFNSTVCICCLICLGKAFKVDAFDFFMPAVASVIMFFAVRLILSLVSGKIGLLIAILGGAIIYFVIALPLTLDIFKGFLSKFKLRSRNVC